MNPYKNTSFLKLTLRFFIVFFVLVTLIRLSMDFFKFEGIDGLKNVYLNDEQWRPFLKTQLAISLLYSLLMAGYYKFIKK
ncbi:MAG: hypothetical protein KAH07_04245 [Flavobacteriaceae bacterium]|nr:hypothetical protein [Flavobacteriaceae bacterium]